MNDCTPLDANHERIWLSAPCEGERTWCADPAQCCDDCGAGPIEYIRADLHTAEIERLREQIEAHKANTKMTWDQGQAEIERLRRIEVAARAVLQAVEATHDAVWWFRPIAALRAAVDGT